MNICGAGLSVHCMNSLARRNLLLTVTGLLVAGQVAYAASTGALKQYGNEIADTVDKVMPSVVVIRTEATQYHIARDTFWGNYYRIPEKLAGQGSGVIITKDEYCWVEPITLNVGSSARHRRAPCPASAPGPHWAYGSPWL